MEANRIKGNEGWAKGKWWIVVLILLLLVAPAVLSEFYLTVLCEALVMAMLAISFNLLFGYMGQMSFGQAAFYGLGGYAVAMLMVDWQFNFWLSIVAGVPLAAFAGLIAGAGAKPGTGWTSPPAVNWAAALRRSVSSSKRSSPPLRWLRWSPAPFGRR